mmetsp:Transcript_16515/g.24647  ORF Transcript_16515/g.24647 Transcript_16515/m.24647 type:complete len:117 (+) Transcript_16515:7-357(+)
MSGQTVDDIIKNIMKHKGVIGVVIVERENGCIVEHNLDDDKDARQFAQLTYAIVEAGNQQLSVQYTDSTDDQSKIPKIPEHLSMVRLRTSKKRELIISSHPVYLLIAIQDTDIVNN